MINIYGRSRKLLAWSLYGFALIFAIFAASNSNAQVVSDPSEASVTHVDNGYFNSKADALNACRIHQYGFINGSCNVGGTYEELQWETANGGYYCYSKLVKVYNSEGSLPQPEENWFCSDYDSHLFNVVTQTFHYFSYSLGAEPVDLIAMPDNCSSGVVGSVGSFSCFSAPVVCEQGEISADCGVECPATEWFPSGFVGHGQTCGAPSSGDGLASFTDNPIADYACVGSSGLLKCDTGLNNGQTGSGSGGSHTMDDTFYQYCLNNPQDVECGGTFEQSPLPTCMHGGQPDPNLGCDYTLAEDTTCPAGQQLDSLGACVAVGFSFVPNAPPNPAFVGGVLGGSGSGDGEGEGDLDVSGIIDAVEDVERSVDEGNATLEQMLEEMTDDQASGGDSCSSAPVCDGDPVGCAIVKQAWLARCDEPEVLLQMTCGSPFVCDGDSFQCVVLEKEFDFTCANQPTTGQALTDEAIAGTSSGLGNMANTLGLDLETMGENKARREAEGYQSFTETDVGALVDELDFGESVSGSCPADISFSILGGKEFIIPISTYCDFLFYIGVLIRLSAGFVGLRIIFRGLMGV
ncbi:hypothetical protein OAK26_01250 [Gammaproteobacteria bacterium]|nr:hypothetical protein [Gammaproteobacteria bacterium]